MHKIIVITKAQKSSANAFCNLIGAEGETFTNGLYTNGVLTHYWAGWLVTDNQWELLKERNYQFFDSPDEALSVTKLEQSQETVE